MSDHPLDRRRQGSGWAALVLAASLLAALGALAVTLAQAPPALQPATHVAFQRTSLALTGHSSGPPGVSHGTPITRPLYLPLVVYGYPPPPECFSLILGVDPAGRGEADAEPPPNCDAARYLDGTPVQIAAAPVLGWDFAGWQGDLAGNANPADLVMDANRVVTAAFVLEEYTLSIAKTGHGGVDVDPELPAYHYGDLVVLAATPELGWAFAGWTGDLVGGDNPAPLTMDGDKMVTASFLEGQVGPLVYGGHTVDDDPLGASRGNGDGAVDCGETVELVVNLHNVGKVIALGVGAVASAGDVNVSWPQAQSLYPDIPRGEVATGDAPFVFAVAPATRDGHLITVTLTISAANAGTWIDAFTLPVTCKPDERTVRVSVVASEDDAEEQAAGSPVDLSSPVLELGEDGEPQVTGIRFQGIHVPQGAAVTNAYIELTAAISDSQPASLVFQGQASDDASAFESLPLDITSRMLTLASVAWDDVPAWEAEHAIYRTPDLSPIVQEIVDREAWSECRALAFLVSGTGQRAAVAYDGDPDLAPQLHLTYQVPPLVGWDPRLDLLGVHFDPAPVTCGRSSWKLVEARWADPYESAGLHHIFFDVLDQAGERVMGQPVVVTWPTGSVTILIDKPPSEWGTNFPMYHTLGAYDAYVGGGWPSDRVVGLGMGTPANPDVKFHTSFYLTFQQGP